MARHWGEDAAAVAVLDGKCAGAGADRPAAPAGPAGRAVARHHRHCHASRRGKGFDPAQPRRDPLRVLARRHRHHPDGRECAAQSGPAARARRCPGQLRPDPHPRRPQQRPVPARRHSVAGRPVAFHQRPDDPLCAKPVADHRRPAGAVRLPPGRRRRHHAQVGHHESRRRGQHDGRLAQLPAAGLFLWRPHRAGRLFLHRSVPPQRRRHRESDGVRHAAP